MVKSGLVEGSYESYKEEVGEVRARSTGPEDPCVGSSPTWRFRS